MNHSNITYRPMQRTFSFVLLVFGLLICTESLAQVPKTLSATSVLTDDNGDRLEGNFILTYRLYASDTGGSPLWEESQGVEVNNGIVQVVLGSVEDLSVPFDSTYWVGVSVNSGDELVPRLALTSSPYSLMARHVSDEAIVAGNNVTLERNPDNQLVISAADQELQVGNTLNAADGDPEAAVFVDNDGNVGVGTQTPAERLTVTGVVQSASGGFKFPDGTVQTTAAVSSASIWSTNGATINYSSGNVGIGDATPAATLTIGDGDKVQISGSDGDIVLNDDQGSLRFANVSGESAPMIQMFQSGTNNPTRMVLAHSPSFPRWGIQYNDTTDAFTYVGDAIPVLHLQLAGQQQIGVGTMSPEAKLHVHSNSATGYGQLKLTESQADYSRITMNNDVESAFWDIAGRVGADEATSTINFFHSTGGDVFTVRGDGRVGINDASPNYTLDIDGSGNTRGINVTGNMATTVNTTYNYGVRASLTQETNTGFPRLYNFYGISTDNDAYLSYGVYAYASGASNNNYGVYAFAPTTNGYAGYFSGNVYTTGSYLPSDEKLKSNIQTLSSGLEKVLALRPITSEYLASSLPFMSLPEGQQFGFTAQNVKAVMPELVRTTFQPYDEARSDTPEGQGFEFDAVNYTGMIPVLVSAIQEQQAVIEALKAEIDALKAANR